VSFLQADSESAELRHADIHEIPDLAVNFAYFGVENSVNKQILYNGPA
jgi:hypothetical protein